VTKIDPPWKRPKCHLNDQNRHFAFSEPPGPALFEFQGVPRDPVLRPKLDPPYFSPFLTFFNVRNWLFHFYHFVDFHVFAIFMKCPFSCFVHFCGIIGLSLITHKKEDDDMCGGFSPQVNNVICLFCFVFYKSGRFTGEEIVKLTLVLPSVF